MEARLRKQQEESEKDSMWLQKEETNLKKRLSLITAVNAEGGDVSGPLSGSYHGTQSGPHSLGDHFSGATHDIRPTTPGSNSGTLSKSITRSMERSMTPSSGSDEKLISKVNVTFNFFFCSFKIVKAKFWLIIYKNFSKFLFSLKVSIAPK